jgi:hypothetical protein
MFSSKGLFKGIPCPNQDDCLLPACIFLHQDAASALEDTSKAKEYDPLGAGLPNSPPTKKRKIDHLSSLASRSVDHVQPRIGERRQVEPDNGHSSPHVQLGSLSTPVEQRNGSTKVITISRPPDAGETSVLSAMPTSSSRTVSPPPKKAKMIDSTPSVKVPTAAKVESLIPRPVPKEPDLLKKRLSILQGFHQQLTVQNKRVEAKGPSASRFVLSEAELVKFVLDAEEDAARSYESEIYRNHITQQIFKVKKMSEEDWIHFVTQKIWGQIEETPKAQQKQTDRPSTGLSDPSEELAVLRSLRTSLAGLEEFGYVTKQLSSAEISVAKARAGASAGWEKCDRCETRFQVFPGRDEQGQLTTGGQCRYHWARGSRPPPQKTDRTQGRAAFNYPCCNQPVGSEGCTEAETHVFKVADKQRLASLWQFEHTPTNDHAQESAISYDCEMCYTTDGMEVIRITALSWPEGKELLDVLVRPYGEVLDLNTRFSGVSKKQFMEAPQYQPHKKIEDGEEANGQLQHLQKVQSPAVARQLLFDLLAPETPLIGHAIDNDLNVMRIIHPLVIDTVLLYPHPKGLPMRFGLKALAAKHLDRHIQVSDASGHDSKEDAMATGDLVTVAVAEKWKKMKRDGWSFSGGVLLAPQLVKKPGKAVL